MTCNNFKYQSVTSCYNHILTGECSTRKEIRGQNVQLKDAEAYFLYRVHRILNILWSENVFIVLRTISTSDRFCFALFVFISSPQQMVIPITISPKKTLSYFSDILFSVWNKFRSWKTNKQNNQIFAHIVLRQHGFSNFADWYFIN